MEQKRKQTIIIASVALAIAIIASVFIIIRIYKPSNEVKDLKEYYPHKDNEILVFMQNSLSDKKAMYAEGSIYLDYTMVVEQLNHRFYWDPYENILCYTTPTEIIKATVGSNKYTVNKSEKTMQAPIVKVQGDEVYISIDYVKQYSNMEYEFFKEPNRIVIQNDYDTAHTYATVEKGAKIREADSIKSPILKETLEEETVICIDSEEEYSSKFMKVMTTDGVIGFVRTKDASKPFSKQLESNYKEPEYSSQTRNETINLVWHQVTNVSANNGVLSLLENTKGVNVISPTWYSVTSEEGDISSLASAKYVERAHSQGVEVWALIDDFNKEVNKAKLLAKTSSREKLSNTLVADAIKYNLDGINVDFENITAEAGPQYMQFLRELSVKCRNNGIVLSVDNYVPMPYNKHYDKKEQGIIADYVIVMAYDEYYPGSEESGSVSSIGYVKQATENILKEVPKEKVIMALPFYTRLWQETGEGETKEITSQAYSMPNAEEFVTLNKIKLVWNEEAGQHYAQLKKDGILYKMWLEDEASYELKLKAIFNEEIAGVANWKLGLETKEIWNLIEKYIH